MTEPNDSALRERMVAEGFIRATRHPRLPLTLYNYTAKAQYEKVWNDATLSCRGLIIDDDGLIVARPFPKFFNLHEHPDGHPDMVGPFTVSEKMDGSLGVVWRYGDEQGVATRGSFTSEQAAWATEWWNERHQAPVGLTPLVEIIYPANRIVVDYGERAECVLLAALNRDGHPVDWHRDGLAEARRWDAADLSPADVIRLDPTGEGFVLHWPTTGFRVKVKHAEYVRLHKLVTMTSTKTVWEHLSEGGRVEDLAEGVPDEFHDWLRATAKELTDQFNDREAEVVERFEQLRGFEDRKAFAAHATKTPYASELFRLFDGRSCDDLLWKAIKPEHSRPRFAQSEDVA